METAEAVRDGIRWGIRKLLEDSAKPAYTTLFHDYGIDLLPAIPDAANAPVNEAFWHREVPQLIAKVERRREAAANRAAKRQGQG